MPTNIIMPQLGESIAEGTIVKWLIAPGDRVEKDQSLLEVETDKVALEIPSPAAGFLTEVLVQEGQTVPVGELLGQLEAEQSAAAKEVVNRVSGVIVKTAPSGEGLLHPRPEPGHLLRAQVLVPSPEGHPAPGGLHRSNRQGGRETCRHGHYGGHLRRHGSAGPRVRRPAGQGRDQPGSSGPSDADSAGHGGVFAPNGSPPQSPR